MESPKRAPADPSKRVWRAAVLGWLLSLAAARGVTIDPDVVLQLNSGSLSTLSLRVVEKLMVTLSRPVVAGAAALMEVLSRVLLLLLALVLCAAPRHREAILQRARSFLQNHVEVAVRRAHQPSLLRPFPALRAAPPPQAAASFFPLRLRLTPDDCNLQAVATHVVAPVATASAGRVADRRSAERAGRRCGGRGQVRADRCDELAGRGARAGARCGRGAAQWTCTRGVCQGGSHAPPAPPHPGVPRRGAVLMQQLCPLSRRCGWA